MPRGVAVDRVGNVYFSDYSYSRVWKLAPVPNFCNYVASTPAVQAGTGGSLSITVTTATGCNWTASSDLPWASISSGSSGSGNGTVSLTIGSNVAGQARTGSIVIAGQIVSLTQNGAGCTYAFNAARQAFGPAGGPGGVMLTVMPSSCSWSISSAASWITLTSPANGTGTANVTYSRADNPFAARTSALIASGGQARVTITQSGVPAVVWQNQSTRQVTVNYFGGPGGASLTGWDWLHAAQDVAGWRVVAVADFDGNGVPDLVWQNDSTKQVTVNYYGGPTGTTIIGWNWLYLVGPGGWHIVGAGDFNGDGVPDLVWQNDTTNQVTVNYFGGSGGATLIGWNYLYPQGIPGWHVVAVADFNSDAVPDVVWMKDDTHQVTVHYFSGPDGTTFSGWNWLNPGGVPGWHVVAASDFNGDGVPDLVWLNESTSQITVNYYGGTGGATLTGWNWLYPGGSSNGWSVVH